MLLLSACGLSELPWGRDSAGGGLLCAFDAALRPKCFVSFKYCRDEGYSRVAAATAAGGFNIAGGRGLGTPGCCQAGIAWGDRESRGSRCWSGLGLQGGRA